jgi:hypothetical protein
MHQVSLNGSANSGFLTLLFCQLWVYLHDNHYVNIICSILFLSEISSKYHLSSNCPSYALNLVEMTLYHHEYTIFKELFALT